MAAERYLLANARRAWRTRSMLAAVPTVTPLRVAS